MRPRWIALLAILVGLGLGPAAVAASPSVVVAPAVVPDAGAGRPGTELYGYLPYWEMTSTVADYVARLPLTDLELFSVSAGGDGGLRKTETGYRRITGDIGARLIREAHDRGQRVQLVFTSFEYGKNAAFFGRSSLDTLDDRRGVQKLATPAGTAGLPWRRTSAELVALASQLGVDGIDVDVELIRGDGYEGYTAFLADLRARLDEAIPGAKLTVATMADGSGADLARAAIAGGVDRVFLMGYEYHWSGGSPGASAPIVRVGDGLSLISSIATYAAAGVPPSKTILGLPLFGMSWTVATPSPFAAKVETGVHWFPSDHVQQLTTPGFEPWFDWPETVEFVASPIVPKVGASPAPGASAVPGSSPAPGSSATPGASSAPPAPTWTALFYDSPRTLRPKLALAVANGFAGAGFWAIGYERGVPGYIGLMADFHAGLVTTAPPISLSER